MKSEMRGSGCVNGQSASQTNPTVLYIIFWGLAVSDLFATLGRQAELEKKLKFKLVNCLVYYVTSHH